MRAFFVVLCLLAATACDENSPSGPTVPLDERFTLAPAGVAVVDGGGAALQVQFIEVTGDSRCPADAVCIQGGDAIVHVQATDSAGRVPYELHTGDSARAAVAHGAFRIELVELQPYPFSSRPIEAADYRATLRVTRP